MSNVDYIDKISIQEKSMLVSRNKTHLGKSSEPTIIECQGQKKFPQLSSNMKNYCGVHLQLVKKIDGGGINSVIKLNPESQIKILENNLNFLSKKNSSLKKIDLKNSSCSSSPCSDSTSISSKTGLHDDTKLGKMNENIEHKIPSGGESVRQCINSNVDNQFDISNENLPSESPCPNINVNKSNNSKCKSNYNLLRRTHTTVGCTKSEPSPNVKTNNTCKDGDNLYEFTLEHEKIVSFVCSPSPTRKQRASRGVDEGVDSDLESDVNTEKHSPVVDKLKSTSYKNPSAFKSFKENCMLEQSAKGARLLWHPPCIGKYTLSRQESNSFFNCCSLSNKCSDASIAETLLSFGNTANPIGALNKKKILKSSFSQESVLFREASLRGCYNIENIIRDVKPPQRDIEQNISKVRESIYSAIRVQKSNDDIVPDGVVAILDICKSWINLNSHFERQEFKELVESYGIDSTVVSDFLHWQCISRSFIDKMVEALRKITYNRKPRNSQCFNNNGSFNVNFQGSNVNKRYMNVPIVDGENSHYFKEPGGYGNISKNELSNSKNWRQRRFLLDQQKADKSKRLVKPKLTTSNCMHNIPNYPVSGNLQFSFGQGHNIPLYYSQDYSFGKSNSSLPTNSTLPSPSSIGLNATSHSIFPNECTKNGEFYKTGQKGSNELCVLQRDNNIDNLRPMNELMCCPAPTIMGLASNHNPLSVQTMPTVPQYYNNQICYVSSGHPQSNLSQGLSQNPILCIDTDMSENCMKNSYMKPGNYNPPQKPTNCFRMSNNTIPIKEEEVIGVSFLYSSDTQSIFQEMKGLNSEIISRKHGFSDDQFVDSTEDSWKDALSSAKTVRENLIATKIESPNLKLSETVSFKSHFLLSDDISQHSSSNELKIESEYEEFNVPDASTPSEEISVTESRLKTTDWLINSFNESVSDNEQELCRSINRLSYPNNSIDDEVTKTLNTEISRDHDKKYEVSTKNMNLNTVTTNNYDSEKNTDSNPSYQNSVEYPHKKTKKGKRIRNDCMTYFDHPETILHRKPKSIFKRAVTKNVSFKLEDILNCMWKVDVSNLITDDVVSEKEKTQLEVNVRSPLYLQAMKCKLSNHSYDTLEQALADFQQYFVDTRNRNKGDKQSIEAVTALEQLFYDLVEKNFGLTKQLSSQIMGPVGVKARRPKKTIRRC